VKKTMKEMSMQTVWRSSGLAALGALALSSVPAIAQVQPQSQEVGAYAGAVFGDDLTKSNISGRQPELDDDVAFGLRYGYNFNEAWGLDVALGYSPNKATGLPGGDIDLNLTTLDVDAVYHFPVAGKVVPYVLAGVGYVSADLDRPIAGLANGQPVAIDDDDGFTANAGLGAKFYLTDQFLLRVEGKYRYLDKLVDNLDDSLNTFEATLGASYQF
jgi:outer membrane beta-barrel protein